MKSKSLTYLVSTGLNVSCLITTLSLFSTLAMASPATGIDTVSTDTFIAPSNEAKRITLALCLPSRDPAGAAAFVHDVGEPGNSLFRKYLKPRQYAARFGASQSDYYAVVAWAAAKGLTVGEPYSARTVLSVSGTVAALGAALNLTFEDFRDQSGRIFYAADNEPNIPNELAGKITGIVGLSSKAHHVPLFRIRPSGKAPQLLGHGPGGGYSAADLRHLYAVPPQPFGPGQVVAVFEQGGYYPADIAKYLQYNKLPPIPNIDRNVDGYGGGVNDPNIALEAALDIDMVAAINPAVKKIIVYESGADSFPVALLTGISATASDDEATSIGISYGQDEALQGKNAIAAENAVFTQMAAQGQAVFVSAGDGGAYGNGTHHLNVADPASQPLVTSVGGTSLFPGLKEAYGGEYVWNDLGNYDGATGGGVSRIWPIPSYQPPSGPYGVTYNGGSATMRNVPDVASVGDPNTGVAIYSGFFGGWFTIGGTSAAAPIWAGFYSLANGTSEGLELGSLGFANPAIYYFGPPGVGHLYPDFNDVTAGTNGDASIYTYPGYNAGTFYDNTTGWGSFVGEHLLTDLVLLPTNSELKPPPQVKELKAEVTATTIALSWTGAKQDTGFFLQAFKQNPPETVVTETFQKSTVAKLTGLLPDTIYSINVVSISPGGNTVASDFVTTGKKTP